jgi:hypothetical protein
MTNTQRKAADLGERKILADVAEYGWHPSSSGRAVLASCPRSTTAAQRRDSGPPPGSPADAAAYPLPLPYGKARQGASAI